MSTGYKANIVAINAAKKELGADWKEKATIEKIDGLFYIQLKQVESVSDEGAKAEAEALAAQQAGDELANRAELQAPIPGKPGKVWVRESSVGKPTKLVWAIADEMIAAAAQAGQDRPTRTQIQDECVRRGVASGTARTQYQAWKKANDNALANAEAAAAASARFNQKN